MSEEEFLTIDELLARWKNQYAKQTLADWRAQGKGPKFKKIGKKVLYRIKDVIEYEEQGQK
jgi:hypothetical protein